MKRNSLKSILSKPVLAFFVLLFIYSCKSSTENEISDPHLELIATYPLEIEQPSDITFNSDYTAYWIVGGGKEKIYKTDLNGNILQTLSFKGEDPEGIYYDGVSQTLWITEEELREVVQLDLNGNELARYKTNITGTSNNGFEGIVFDDEKNIYLANEKNPRKIIVFNKNFNKLREIDFDYAEDLSGLYYNTSTKNFFVLSDESKALFVWNTENKLIDKFDLPFTKSEGITANPSTNKIIIVNDSLNTMYEYELKQ